MSVHINQIWASNDKRDVESGRRQYRRVEALLGEPGRPNYKALLNTDGRLTEVRIVRGGVDRHRFVSHYPTRES